MSFALSDLSRLLAPETLTLGAVVATNPAAGTVRIATARGAVQAKTIDNLSIGDRVQINNGIASKAPAPRATYAV